MPRQQQKPLERPLSSTDSIRSVDMRKGVKTVQGTLYTPVSSIRPVSRERVKHTSNVSYQSPNGPTVLKMMKTSSVEEVLAARVHGVVRNNRLPPPSPSLNNDRRSRRIRRPGRRPISPTGSHQSESVGPRSPLHSLYMNSVDNLRAEKWMVEQQEQSRDVMEDDEPGSEKDEVEMLREHCNTLAHRLQAMEEHFMSTEMSPNRYDRRPATTPANFRERTGEKVAFAEDSIAALDQFTGEFQDEEGGAPALTFTLKEIKGTLARLDGVFATEDEDSDLKMGNAAVTIIATQVRGWLVREKYKKLKTTLRRWRRRRTQPVRREFARVVRRRKMVDNGVALMVTTRSMNCVRSHHEAWASHAMALLPLRKKQRKGASDLALRIRNKFLLKIMKTWWELANGPDSRKAIRFKNKARKDQAKERIMKRRRQRKLPQTLITKEMISEEMSMEATRLIHSNRDRVCKKDAFVAWAVFAVAPWRYKRKIADVHFKKVRGKAIFHVFRKFNKGRHLLHGAAKKKYTGRKRWEMKHNLHVIKIHHSHRLLKSHFVSWRKRAHQLQTAKRSFEGHISNLSKTVLAAWHIEAQRQFKIKQLCVAEWRAYGIALYKTPFRAWYIFASKRKAANQATNTLLQAWSRRKTRSFMNQVFKVWRHQAQYGKTEGMHTRLELIKVVEDQKKVQNMMTRNLEKAEGTLSELKNALTQERQNSDKLKEKAEDEKAERDRLEFAVHNAEQEIVRLQAMLDSLSLIHPGTIKQLKSLDESRQFPDKQLDDLARARGKTSMDVETSKPKTSAPPPLALNEADKGVSQGHAGAPIDIPGFHDAPLEEKQKKRGEGKTKQEAHDPSKVWVSPYDADVILRVKHIQEALKKGTEKKMGMPAPVVEKPKTVEEARLRALLLYLTSGDEEILQQHMDEAAAMENAEAENVEEGPSPDEEEEQKKVPLRAHLGLLNRDKISRTAKWSDFLQDMSAMYPLRHRINIGAQERLAQRVAVAKKNSDDKKLYGRGHFNLLSVTEEEALKKGTSK